MSERQLHIGTFLAGISSGDWRDPDVEANVAANIDAFKRYARIAEDAKFDLGFIADTTYITKDFAWPLLSRIEPVTALSALAPVTTHLGLAGTISTTFGRPFDVARQLASLDLISGGRAGWNVVTSSRDGAARNYGLDHLPSHELRYEMAEEHIAVVRGLWHGWADDAFVRDRATGQYIDPNKFFPLNHVGKHYSVVGPLNVERSAQGHPVIFQAGASEAGKLLAAKTADAIFAPGVADRELGQENYRDWKRLAVEQGRNPDHLLVFPSFSPVVGVTTNDAQEQYEKTNRFKDIDHCLQIISRYFNNRDLRPYLDRPFPDDIDQYSLGSLGDGLVRQARRLGLTVREAALREGRPSTEFVGSAVDIAGKIEDLFLGGALDGLMLTVSEENLKRFTDLVVPILQDRGLFRTDYEGSTLREHLGLPFPVNPNSVATATA